ncbi:MAG: B12-binding domain-containing radical SAM protein, partial [Gammaproteobacteria bacterium]|nr:B12-binding domain-containing radical SAM protein [Gammaproteobacteria bacterium]
MKPGIALITLHAGYSHSSIALRSIATYCRDEPYYAGISLYEPLVQGNHHWLMAQLEETKPQIIGFSTYLWNIQASLRLARNLKKLLPDSCIVFGGPEAGPRGKQLLDTETALDFVVDGEGERAFRDLVTWRIYGRGSLPKISGLIWRDSDGRILHNPVQVLPVEELPSLFTTGVADLEKPLIYWETSRGCPYRCTFCTSATDRLRTIPWERIDADLEIILGLENRTVKLLDRSFHLGTARTIRLLKRFLHSPDSLRFHLELNPDRISPEVIKIFSQASPGKFQFEIGLQTLDGQVLANIDRLMDVQHGLENIRTLIELKKHPVHLDLLVGLPDEDRSGCRDSLDRVFLLFPHHLQLGTLKLLPGTPLRQQATRFGYTWDDEPPYEILGHRHLEFLDLIRFKHYGELLERLWNSDLLVNTLMWLIPNHFAASVSDCFDYL